MSSDSELLTLHLIRHAPTLPNAQRRYPHAGEDAPLSESGRALAAELRHSLPASALAYSSPAQRALQTAALAGFPHAQPTPALQEASFGVMAGHTWAELEALSLATPDGAAPRDWIDALSDPDSDFGPPGGETGRAFHARLQVWLDTLPHAETVVAFTHAGPLLALLRLTVGLCTAEIAPGGRAVLKRSGQTWWLSHLSSPALSNPAQENS